MGDKCWGCGADIPSTTDAMGTALFCAKCKDWGGASYKQGLAAGRAEGVRECVEFLEKNAGKLTLDEIIAALEGVRGEK